MNIGCKQGDLVEGITRLSEGIPDGTVVQGIIVYPVTKERLAIKMTGEFGRKYGSEENYGYAWVIHTLVVKSTSVVPHQLAGVTPKTVYDWECVCGDNGTEDSKEEATAAHSMHQRVAHI